MKTIPRLFNACSILWTVLLLADVSMPTASQAATNAPAIGVERSDSSTFKNVQVYSIRFPGGRVSDFFKFMRTNGFASDTILFAGEASRVRIPAFTVSNVQLKEVAKSIEFIAEEKIIVELIEAPHGGDANIWRIKTHDGAVSEIKTRSCAVPNLLAGAKSKERVREIIEQVVRALVEGADRLYRNQSLQPAGNVTIIETEKIVVAVGTEAYVEAIASALDAAERSAATVNELKKQSQ